MRFPYEFRGVTELRTGVQREALAFGQVCDGSGAVHGGLFSYGLHAKKTLWQKAVCGPGISSLCPGRALV